MPRFAYLLPAGQYNCKCINNCVQAINLKHETSVFTITLPIIAQESKRTSRRKQLTTQTWQIFPTTSKTCEGGFYRGSERKIQDLVQTRSSHCGEL